MYKIKEYKESVIQNG